MCDRQPLGLNKGKVETKRSGKFSVRGVINSEAVYGGWEK